MKKCFVKAVIGFALLISLFSSGYATEEYKLDPAHTYVLWHINHFGFSNPSGKWMAEGTLHFDKDKIENSKVDVSINVVDFITGIPKLDEHLKGQTFFDVSKFPKATFVSDKVKSNGNKRATVHGTLTVHGVSKPVALEVMMNQVGKSPVTNKDTVGFSAHTQIKRSDFGLNAYLPGLSDDVKIAIELEATKA